MVGESGWVLKGKKYTETRIFFDLFIHKTAVCIILNLVSECFALKITEYPQTSHRVLKCRYRCVPIFIKNQVKGQNKMLEILVKNQKPRPTRKELFFN